MQLLDLHQGARVVHDCEGRRLSIGRGRRRAGGLSVDAAGKTAPQPALPLLHDLRRPRLRAREQEALGGVFYAVAVASLDDADHDELAGSIKYVDGRHDHFDKTPEDTRYL
jgi:hypothetical protein